MKAFVINEDQIKMAGLGLVVIIILVFLLGYFTGAAQIFPSNEVAHQEKKSALENAGSNAEDNGAASELSAAQLNTNNKIQKIKSAEKKPAKKLAQKSDKKVAKNKADKKTKKVEKKDDKKNLVKENKKSADKKIKNKKAEKKKQTSKADKAAGQKNNTKQASNVAQVLSSQERVSNKKQDTSLIDADRTYSIQTGMFSSENNANTFIEKLSAKKFDAYISDFVSSSGAIKFNVRVGKFAKREQARELLKDFQKSFSSPAYVVISQP